MDSLFLFDKPSHADLVHLHTPRIKDTSFSSSHRINTTAHDIHIPRDQSADARFLLLADIALLVSALEAVGVVSALCLTKCLLNYKQYVYASFDIRLSIPICLGPDKPQPNQLHQ